MTQTLIEKLEALHSEYEDADCNAYYMANDLRSIIDEAPPIHDLTKLVEELVEALEWALLCIHFDDDDPDMKEAVKYRDEVTTILTRAKEYLK